VWSLDYLCKISTRYRRSAYVREREGGHAWLIVWPESPAPSGLPTCTAATLANIARATNSYIIAGSIGIDHTGDPTAIPISTIPRRSLRRRRWTERYNKIHLSLSASTSFRKAVRFRQRAYPADWNFCAGKSREPLDVGDTKAGVFICYESIFPDECDSCQDGAEVFVNVSNDGWYGEGGAPRQHLNMARMRAVENDRWLLRDTNTGITAVIDPFGRVVAEARAISERPCKRRIRWSYPPRSTPGTATGSHWCVR